MAEGKDVILVLNNIGWIDNEILNEIFAEFGKIQLKYERLKAEYNSSGRVNDSDELLGNIHRLKTRLKVLEQNVDLSAESTERNGPTGSRNQEAFNRLSEEVFLMNINDCIPTNSKCSHVNENVNCQCCLDNLLVLHKENLCQNKKILKIARHLCDKSSYCDTKFDICLQTLNAIIRDWERHIVDLKAIYTRYIDILKRKSVFIKECPNSNKRNSILETPAQFSVNEKMFYKLKNVRKREEELNYYRYEGHSEAAEALMMNKRNSKLSQDNRKDKRLTLHDEYRSIENA